MKTEHTLKCVVLLVNMLTVLQITGIGQWISSKNFNIKQGVVQGGVLSTHLYKSYINDLPLELENRGLGLTIGLEYCGSPLCADDIVHR